MRFVYFGTGLFALPALRRIAKHVCAVVTQPDKPTGRKQVLTPTPAKVLATELGIPVFTPEKARDLQFIESIRALDADALIVASYGQILKPALLESAKRGGINLHGSILPAYRGAAPIQRALLKGEKVTGVTLMQMDSGMDTGEIIEIVETPIKELETYGELQDRLAEIAADLIEKRLEDLYHGDYQRLPQDESKATLAPKVERYETILDFEEPAYQAICRWQAFTPNPGVWATTSLGRLKIHRLTHSDGADEPGTIIALDEGITVAHHNGAVTWLQVQPEGKTAMSARDYARGARLTVGQSLRNT